MTPLALALALAAGDLRVMLTVRDGGKTVDLPVERYVAAVLAGESGAFRSDEALKAMAVAVRTYAAGNRGRHAKEGYDLCGTTHCQLVDLRSVTARFERAAEATAGELLWDRGKPAAVVYSADCGGGRDPYCVRAGSSRWQWLGDGARIGEALRRSGLRAPSTIERIHVVRRATDGRVELLRLAGAGESVTVSATAFRFAIGRALGWNTLRSDMWTVESGGGRFVFDGRGAGHGRGLCQLGADQMGVEGRSYGEILKFYFPGAREIEWQRLGGERVTLLTTRAARDGGVVGLADRIAGEIDVRGVELRVYPDVETFRNVTGEPGWVAAYTAGRRIHLQYPVAGSTLRHELLHVMVEKRAAAGVPVWFREGLVGYLASGSGGNGKGGADDADVRERSDRVRARRAYEEARGRVVWLVKRYGEGTVLEWLKRGLPAEVAQASASRPPAKSK